MVDINGLRCYILIEMDFCKSGDYPSLKSVDEKLKILLAIVLVYEIIGGSFSFKYIGTVSMTDLLLKIDGKFTASIPLSIIGRPFYSSFIRTKFLQQKLRT